jgi:integrase
MVWRQKIGKRGILDGELAGVRLRDLTAHRWDQWQEAQTRLSGRSRAIVRAAYAALLTHAERSGHIAEAHRFYRIKGATKRTRPQSDPLDVDEVRRLLAVADPMRKAMWAVGVGQGLRPGELVRCEWGDIDWTDRVLAVRGTKTNDSAAVIPLTPLAHDALRALWVRLGQPSSGRCFTYGGNGLEREPSKARPFVSYKRALESDRKAAKIGRKVTPYLLRHSFATIAWSLGIDRDTAKRIMRHTAGSSLLDRVYVRPPPRTLVAKVAAFDVGSDRVE